MTTKKVCIIGAGLSGLLACKYILAKGFHPIVFEAKNNIGGVWTKTLDNTKLQTHKTRFQFSDFPWPSSVTEDFPDQEQVMKYIIDYANHFDLLKYINFNTKVLGIEYEGVRADEMQAWHLWCGTGEPFNSKGKWKVSVLNAHKDTTEVYSVDFVILCLGRFSDIPNIPEFPINGGPKVFEGKVMHAMDYISMDSQSAAELVEGKQVTVVGFQRNAIDIALECTTVNGVKYPCRVLFRTEHWHIPDGLPWGVPIGYLYRNRFAELLVHKPNEGFLLSLIATVLTPVRWAFSMFVESHIKRKLGLEKFGMVPHHSFHQEVNSCLAATVPEKFYDKVEEGSIILKKAPRFWFCKEGVLIEGEENSPLNTDLVILATGYKGEKKLKDIFVSSYFQNLITGPSNSPLRLYRLSIHPEIPQLAVIGFAEGISNLFNSEMSSRWIAELLDGTFQLPSIEEMKKEVREWKEYKRKYSGQYYKRTCIAGLNIHYNDLLCKDMGLNPRRKKGVFAELFEPYGAMDYS